MFKPIFFIFSALIALVSVAEAQTSGVLREVWTNLDGNAISDFTGSPHYPSNPVYRKIDPDFKSPVDWCNRYGMRMRAYLKPTVTASYTFWVSGDDNCELWLSTDDKADNRVRIARVPSWTAAQVWTTYPEQMSAPVSLQAGKRYYIEALVKEGWGGDSLAVAWATSPTEAPVVIPAANLTPIETAAAVTAKVLVEAGPSITQYAPNYTVRAFAQAMNMQNTNYSCTVQWTQVSGSAAVIATPTAEVTDIAVSNPGTYVFRATATGSGITATDDLTVKVLPALAPDAGSALAEYWFGVSGGTVGSLLNSLDYPNFPHAHRTVSSLTSQASLADQYGERVRGFILAPTTGTYRFYLAGDETAEFYLSPSSQPEGLQLRASAPKATSVEDFYVSNTQVSAAIQLTAGQRYAFEIRRKDEWGYDHCTVLWQMPGSSQISDITGEFLAPPADNAAAVAANQEFDVALDYALNAGRDQVIYLPRKSVNLSAYEARRIWGSDTPTRQWSVSSGAAGVLFSSTNTAATTATFPKAGTYVLRYAVTTALNTTADEVKVQVMPAINANTGYLTRQVWWNRNYTNLDALRADPAFPNYPDIVDNITELRQSGDWGSLYATRVIGILNVPADASGPVDYTFYVSGDDAAEFSISTDSNPNNLRRVCSLTKPSGREIYNIEASQTSLPISLAPGGRYFVELLHKETWGSDNFAVAWSRDGDRQPRVMDGALFEPVQKTSTFDASLNSYAVAGRDRTYYWPQDRTQLAGSIIKTRNNAATPVTLWKQVSGAKATLVDASNLSSEVVFPSAGAYTFELTVTEGEYVHKDSVTITVAPQLAGVTGALLRSVWLDVYGHAVSSLLEFDPTLANPHFEDLLPGVEPPTDWADYYGTRLKGYLTLPTGGQYTFYLASDDASQMTIDLLDGQGPRTIASLQYASAYRNWNYYASQKSVALTLEARISYPIEILHKEQGGGDHLSVALEGPATNGREILSRGFLSPFRTAAAFNPDITVALGSDRTLLWPESKLALAALVYDLAQGPQQLSYRWSSTSTKVTFESPTSPVTMMTFGGPGVYEIKMTASDGDHTSSDTLLVTVSNPVNASAGGLLREAWTGVPGYMLNDLKSSAAYTKAPNYTDVLNSFEAPTNWGDNYGQRLTGFLQVPTAGEYVFLIASDDESELWMNTTGETATGATRIAYTQYATGRYNWTRNTTQKSSPIRLTPGKRYYVQAFQKEGGGDDYLAVAYRRADQADSEAIVVPGVLLSPPDKTTAAAFDGQIGVHAGADQTGYWPRARYSLAGTAVDYIPGPQALAYRWSVLAAPAGAAAKVLFLSPTALSTDVELPAAGAYQLQLTATDGLISRSDVMVITVSPALAAGTGSILGEVYRNIGGSWVTDLTRSTKYPNSPDERMQLRTAEIPSNQGDNYGMLMRGYLYPPKTGLYRFNLASDDWSEVYISTNRLPENKALACFVPSGTDYYEWRRFPDYQLSRPIQLTKGQSYYIEIRFKESGWRDHLALAWLLPGTSEFEVIDGAFMAPWLLTDRVAPTITLTGGSSVTVNVGGTFVDPGFTATDKVDGNISAEVVTEGEVDTSQPGTYLIRYTVTDAAGNVSTVATRQVTVAVAEGADPVHPPDASGNHSTTPWTAPAPAAIAEMDAARFLKQATFGASEATIARIKAVGYSGWLDEQMALPATLHLPQMDRVALFRGAQSALYGAARSVGSTGGLPGTMMAPVGRLETEDRLYTWWTVAATAPDQVRQRAAFALSEIFVISDKSGALRNYPRGCANYYDLLVKSLTPGKTYRDLLEEITLNPIMGTWLTLVRSAKTQPDENYAREIMQLFSIGLEHLNLDGTFKRDASGNAIPTYTQKEILELSRAFTGWTYHNSRSFTWGGNATDDINTMMSFEEYHDRGGKVIVGGATLPAGQTALQDVRRAIDILAAHPNVGPFLAKRLIQRLVKSNPSPAYVFRVAKKFNDNGKGVRGDLCAVVKAILLDPEARAADTGAGAGKLAEPIIRLTRLLRAFPQAPSDNPPVLGRYMLWNAGDDLGQWPMQAPTVFNFFHPDYQPTGPVMDAGLFAPEFEITTELTVTDTANYFFEGLLYGFWTNAGARIGVDLTALTSVWNDPDAVLGKIEILLLGRPMSAQTKTHLRNVHALYPTSPAEGVRTMLQILTAAPEYAAER